MDCNVAMLQYCNVAMLQCCNSNIKSNNASIIASGKCNFKCVFWQWLPIRNYWRSLSITPSITLSQFSNFLNFGIKYHLPRVQSQVLYISEYIGLIYIRNPYNWRIHISWGNINPCDLQSKYQYFKRYQIYIRKVSKKLEWS